MNVSVWLSAFRLRTLPLALSCVAMGAFLAAEAGAFRLDIFLLCVVTTVFLQVLSNLANDYGDSIHGADRVDRVGPSRAVQSGLITSGQMRRALTVFVVLCLVSGVALLLVSLGLSIYTLLFFFCLGVLCIAAAIAYTVGRRPYGYIGLGDLAVLIFFGFVGVNGSYFLFARETNLALLLPALSCGLFSIAVLNVNNIRDIDADRRAGKLSIPVRIGRSNAIVYHWCLLAAGLLAALAYNLMLYRTPWQFLFLLSVPLFLRNGVAVKRVPPAQLDPWLRQMAVSTLIFVILFGIGQIL